jgi:hypothetical protein
LARSSPWALGEGLFAESQKKFLAENKILGAKKIILGEEFFVESISTTLGEEIFLKNHFSPPNFFRRQHALI